MILTLSSLYHVIYAPAKFEGATSNYLAEDVPTRKCIR